MRQEGEQQKGEQTTFRGKVEEGVAQKMRRKEETNREKCKMNSRQIFTATFVEGTSLELCMELDQETRNLVVA